MKLLTLRSLFLGVSLLSATAFAQSSQPIVIGLTTPVTGNAASFADPERRGVEMAVEELNAAGGVLGRPLKLVVADNRCNPTEGVQSANKLINDDKAVALIGAFCSSVSLAIMPVVRRAEVPLVIDVSTAPAISQQIGKGKNTWVFRTSVTDDGMAKALVEHLAGKSTWRRIAVLAEDTDYGRGGIRAFGELANARGITTATTEVIQQGTADFTTAITKLLASKPDAVAVYTLGADMANFLKQYDAWGAKVPVTGRFDPALLSPEQRAKGFLDGSIGVLPYSPDIDTPANKRFVASYRQRNNADPQFQSAYGYEAVHLIAEAIRRAGKVDRAAVREALAKSRMDSIVGTPIEFDAGHQAHNNAVILLLKDGKTRILSLNPT
ncbi:ABC transporter substrate-binding protein [Variovorax sp. M-6]|uniref:ABC transporter substrate-binding protein n=1 Tax=Variovorax sp. M-6 TaxID=3233041 RepID=UPI003F99D7E7